MMRSPRSGDHLLPSGSEATPIPAPSPRWLLISLWSRLTPSPLPGAWPGLSNTGYSAGNNVACLLEEGERRRKQALGVAGGDGLSSAWSACAPSIFLIFLLSRSGRPPAKCVAASSPVSPTPVDALLSLYPCLPPVGTLLAGVGGSSYCFMWADPPPPGVQSFHTDSPPDPPLWGGLLPPFDPLPRALCGSLMSFRCSDPLPPSPLTFCFFSLPPPSPACALADWPCGVVVRGRVVSALWGYVDRGC